MEEQGFTVPRGRGKRGDLYQQAYETQFKFTDLDQEIEGDALKEKEETTKEDGSRPIEKTE